MIFALGWLSQLNMYSSVFEWSIVAWLSNYSFFLNVISILNNFVWCSVDSYSLLVMRPFKIQTFCLLCRQKFAKNSDKLVLWVFDFQIPTVGSFTNRKQINCSKSLTKLRHKTSRRYESSKVILLSLFFM